MPGLRKQLGCFTPSFQGVFPASGTFPFHTLFPGMPLEVTGQLALPTGGGGCSSLQTPVLSAGIFKDGLQPEGWDAASSWVIASAGPRAQPAAPACTPDLHQGLCPAMQPKITQRTGPEPAHFPDTVPKWNRTPAGLGLSLGSDLSKSHRHWRGWT